MNLLELGRELQQETARAINDMLGMHVGEVNIHIDDVMAAGADVHAPEEAEG